MTLTDLACNHKTQITSQQKLTGRQLAHCEDAVHLTADMVIVSNLVHHHLKGNDGTLGVYPHTYPTVLIKVKTWQSHGDNGWFKWIICVSDTGTHNTFIHMAEGVTTLLLGEGALDIVFIFFFIYSFIHMFIFDNHFNLGRNRSRT